MSTRCPPKLTSLACWALLGAALLAAGCTQSEPARFRLNFEGKDRSDVSPEQQQAIVDGLTALFGTPDEPYVVPESGLDPEKLKLAAGPAWSDEQGVRRGLYRQHCAHCHGISGDGAGPTAAFLNPYPRDYRQGKFKFTSTTAGMKPTRDDIRRTLVQGIPGTAMPSFSLLPSDEIDALVEYVKYLAIRGETETLIYDLVVNQEEELGRDVLIEMALVPAVASWDAAEGAVLNPEVEPNWEGRSPEQIAASIEAGRKLYFDEKRTKCAGCHGPTGLGDGGEAIYDDWNDPKKGKKPEEIAQQFSLPIQELQPRNLRTGIYRGGRRPLDLYRRIHAGIKGTPMPSLGPAPGKSDALKPEEIWNLVDFVRSLPYEEAGRAPQAPSSHLSRHATGFQAE